MNSDATVEQFLYYYAADVASGALGFRIHACSPGLAPAQLKEIARFCFFEPIDGVPSTFSRSALDDGSVALLLKTRLDHPDGRHVVHGLVGRAEGLDMARCAGLAYSEIWIRSLETLPEPGAVLEAIDINGAQLAMALPSLTVNAARYISEFLAHSQLDFGTDYHDSVSVLGQLAACALPGVRESTVFSVGERAPAFGAHSRTAFSRANVRGSGMDQVGESSIVAADIEIVVDLVSQDVPGWVLATRDVRLSYRFLAVLARARLKEVTPKETLETLFAFEPDELLAAIGVPEIATAVIGFLPSALDVPVGALGSFVLAAACAAAPISVDLGLEDALGQLLAGSIVAAYQERQRDAVALATLWGRLRLSQPTAYEPGAQSGAGEPLPWLARYLDASDRRDGIAAPPRSDAEVFPPQALEMMLRVGRLDGDAEVLDTIAAFGHQAVDTLSSFLANPDNALPLMLKLSDDPATWELAAYVLAQIPDPYEAASLALDARVGAEVFRAFLRCRPDVRPGVLRAVTPSALTAVLAAIRDVPAIERLLLEEMQPVNADAEGQKEKKSRRRSSKR